MTVHFLHIGKTGGTAIIHALTPIAERHRLVFHGHHVRLRDIPTGDGFFFSVRDPVMRFVSAFNSRKRQGRPRYDAPWSEEERWAFERFATANDLAEAIGSADADRAIAAIGHVKSRYSDWLETAAYVRERNPIMVLHLETIEHDFESLKSLLGLPADVVLPSDPIARHATPGGYDRSLSAKGRLRVREYCASDIDLVEELSCLRTGIRR